MSSPLKRRGWRWQFGLNWLLCLMTACACVAWLWRPQPPTTVESSGLRVQATRKTVDRPVLGGKGFVGDEPAETWQKEVVTGPLRLRDVFGRVLVYGVSQNGVPTGPWRVYHQDGRVAQRVDLKDGKYVKRVVAYDEKGRRVAELSRQGSARLLLASPDGGRLDVTDALEPFREGDVRTWWPNGRLRHRGQFTNDLATGDWEFFDPDGQLTASGTYRRGLRVGVWQERNENGLLAVLWANGLRIENPERLLATAEAQRKSGKKSDQLSAIRDLGRLGSHGAPNLKKMMHGEDTLLAVAALDAFAEFGGASAPLPAIAQLAEQSPAPRVRMAALMALVELDSKVEVDAFRKLLLAAQSKKGTARLQALRALRGLTVRHLSACEALLSDKDASVRYAALALLADSVEQLRSQEEANAAGPLVVQLKDIAKRAAENRDPWVRKAAKEIMIWVDAPSPGPGLRSVIPVVR
jgi:hypothetical protein